MQLNTVYNMDCRQGFWELEKENLKFDLILADPPYFLDRSKTIKFKNRKDINSPIEWDTFTSEDEYLKWTADWLNEAINLLSPTGQLICYCRAEYISDIISMIKQKINHKCTMYYVKTNPPPSVRKRNYVSTVETLLWFVKNSTKYTFNFQRQQDMRNAFILPIPGGKVRKQYPHPTMKPLQLSEHLIKVHTNENDNILIPFAGVGTECVAAKRLNRNFVGFEIDPYYYELCLKRLGINNIGINNNTIERVDTNERQKNPTREASVG
jgi:DNA modification methylase